MDGVSWASTDLVISSTLTQSYETIQVTTTTIVAQYASNDDGFAIVRAIQTDSADPESNTLSYSLAFSSEDKGYMASSSNGIINPNAEIEITSEDNAYISGTFSFVGLYLDQETGETEEITIENGSFKAKKF